MDLQKLENIHTSLIQEYLDTLELWMNLDDSIVEQDVSEALILKLEVPNVNEMGLTPNNKYLIVVKNDIHTTNYNINDSIIEVEFLQYSIVEVNHPIFKILNTFTYQSTGDWKSDVEYTKLFSYNHIYIVEDSVKCFKSFDIQNVGKKIRCLSISKVEKLDDIIKKSENGEDLLLKLSNIRKKLDAIIVGLQLHQANEEIKRSRGGIIVPELRLDPNIKL